MATYRDPKALAISQARRFDQVRRSFTVMHADMVQDMAKEAETLTSGTTSTAQLREMGHPFSRRRARSRGGIRKALASAGIAKLPINRQTGRLQRSLRVMRDGEGWRIQFVAPHAKFVLAPGGTRKMVARGFWPEMRKRFKPRNRRLIYEMRLRQLTIMYKRSA